MWKRSPRSNSCPLRLYMRGMVLVQAKSESWDRSSCRAVNPRWRAQISHDDSLYRMVLPIALKVTVSVLLRSSPPCQSSKVTRIASHHNHSHSHFVAPKNVSLFPISSLNVRMMLSNNSRRTPPLDPTPTRSRSGQRWRPTHPIRREVSSTQQQPFQTPNFRLDLTQISRLWTFRTLSAGRAPIRKPLYEFE